eukprot:TRINITY_DN7277_c0_g1_i1.p1 TRINITY_DN7277_c0_g1~~TRINITY_DN7277_c0_g1_i1.p1  ORF type:complete len:1439 (-),score=455.00 TRINITY_DN7277_c0_g1_i1:80-4396(-)
MGKVFDGMVFHMLPSIPTVEFREIRDLIQKNGGTLTTTPKNESITVTVHFEGKEFEAARKERNTIYSTHLIREAIKHSQVELPREPGTLRYGSWFSDILVATTGFTVERRKELFEKIEWMGGTANSALSASTTHLIATHPTGEKYKEAVKHNIPIVKPEWIESSWEGKGRANFEDFLLPPFIGLTICVSKLDQPERSRLQREITRYGGSFEQHLTKKCTHYAAPAPGGLKYEGAIKWGIEVVSTRWITDCISCCGRLDESNYRLDNSYSPAPRPSASSSHESSSIHSNSNSDYENLTATHEEPKSTCVPSSQIVNSVKFLKGHKVFVSPNVDDKRIKQFLRKMGADVVEEVEVDVSHVILDSGVPNNLPPIVDYLYKTASGIEDIPFRMVSPKWVLDSIQSGEARHTDDYKVNVSINSWVAAGYKVVNDQEADEDLSYSPVSKNNLFSGLHFYLHSILLPVNHHQLRTKIISHGGVFFDTIEPMSFTNYVVAPHGEDLKEINEKLDNMMVTSSTRPPIISIEFVDRCIEEGQVLDHSSSPLFTPLPFSPPYESMRELSIGISGFLDLERNNIAEFIKLLGARYTSTLNRKDTHLIVKTPSGQKYNHAISWNLFPVVSLDWLYHCAKMGKRVDEERFSLDPDTLSRRGIEIKPELPKSGLLQRQSSDPKIVKKENNEPVLAGVTICCKGKMANSTMNKMHSYVAALGGSYTTSPSSEVTHYIYEGKGDPNFIKESGGKSRKAKVVSPVWLEKCFEKKEWIKESDYPYQVNRNMNLDIPPSQSPSSGTISTLRTSYSANTSPATSSFSTPLSVSKRGRTSVENSASKRQKGVGETWSEALKKQNEKDTKKMLSQAGCTPGVKSNSSSGNWDSTCISKLPIPTIQKYNDPETDTPLRERINSKKDFYVAGTPEVRTPLKSRANPTPEPEMLDWNDSPAPPKKTKPAPKPIEANQSDSYHSSHQIISEPKDEMNASKIISEDEREEPTFDDEPVEIDIDFNEDEETVAAREKADNVREEEIVQADQMEEQQKEEQERKDKENEEQKKRLELLASLLKPPPSTNSNHSDELEASRVKRVKRASSNAYSRSLLEDEDGISSEVTSALLPGTEVSEDTNEEIENGSEKSIEDSCEVENSQVPVYINRKEHNARKLLKENLVSKKVESSPRKEKKKNAENHYEINDRSTPPEVTKPSPKKESPKKPVSKSRRIIEDGNPKIVLSNCKDPAIENMIRSLNGRIISDSELSEFTHVVTPQPAASMKCMAACAAGKWLVKLEWVKASCRAGKWLPEDPFEWDEQSASGVTKSATAISIVIGAQKARKQLDQVRQSRKTESNPYPKAGLLEGRNLMFMLDEDQAQQWCTIARSGGASACLVGEDLEGITDIIMDSHRYRKSKADGTIKQYEEMGIEILSIEWLRQFIFSVGCADPNDFPFSGKRSGESSK